VNPILVALRFELPVAARVRLRETHPRIRAGERGLEGIVHEEPSAHRAALGGHWIIRVAGQPRVRPRGDLCLHLRLGVGPERIAGAGVRRRAVAVEQIRSVNLRPVLVRGHAGAGAAVMIAPEVNQVVALGQREVGVDRTVVQVIVAAQHHPDALLVRVAGVAPAADLLILGGVLVFAVVLSGAHARGQPHDLGDPRRIGVHEVGVGAPVPVAQFVHIHALERPLGGRMRQLPHHAPLAHAGGRIRCRVRQHGVGIQPRVAAPQDVVNVDVKLVNARGVVGPGDLAGDVHHVRRVDRGGIDTVPRLLVAAAAVHAEVNQPARVEHLRAVEQIRSNLARALLDDGGDDAVGQRDGGAADRERDIRAHPVGAAAGIIGQRGPGQDQDGGESRKK
jgi:hypothetical protein